MHLGHGDKAIIGARKSLLNAIESYAKGGTPPFRAMEEAAMREKLTEIVVADLIAPDQNKYKEVFYEQHLAAQPLPIVA